MLNSERAAEWAAVLTRCGDEWASCVPLDADRVGRERGEVRLDGYVLRRGTPWTVHPARDGEQ